MRNFSVPDRDFIKEQIKKSQARSAKLNFTEDGKKYQKKLSPDELEKKRKKCSQYLDIARNQVRSLYRFVEGAGFAVTLTDNEGYVLETLGDDPLLDLMKENNCSPGYRWTEADVGTSAISLTIELMQPLQIAEDEHYMESSIKYTCSACPVFGHEGCLVGILALTGLSDKVGIHTLGMVITSAAAMENQLYLTHALQEIEIQNNYLTETIGSLDNAIILIDNSGLIRTMNNSVKKTSPYFSK